MERSRKTLKRLTLLAICLITASACEAVEQPWASDAQFVDEQVAPDETMQAQLPEPAQSASAATDLAPCPGINPDIRRPAGSNCLGITPDQCGADKAQMYVGRQGTDAAQAKIQELAIGRLRWVEYNAAVTDDMQPDRLNVMLDENGVIANVSCY